MLAVYRVPFAQSTANSKHTIYTFQFANDFLFSNRIDLKRFTCCYSNPIQWNWIFNLSPNQNVATWNALTKCCKYPTIDIYYMYTITFGSNYANNSLFVFGNSIFYNKYAQCSTLTCLLLLLHVGISLWLTIFVLFLSCFLCVCKKMLTSAKWFPLKI